jgi:hypothetical protein
MSGLEQIGGNGPSHLANSDHPDLHVLLSPKGRLNIIKRPEDWIRHQLNNQMNQ